MKVGLISDVHANLPALQAVFESGKIKGVKHWYCMGDIVNYYYMPKAVF